MESILLTALNCGCYCKDIENLKKSDFDLSKKTLKMIRQKKKTIKVVALWDITIEALQEYWQNDNPSSEYAFISQKKGKYVAQSVRDYFSKRLRTQLGISNEIKFCHLRDAAATIPAEYNCSEIAIKAILGHKITGKTDSYVKRRPIELTKAATNAIYDYYFNNAKNAPTCFL